MTKDIEMSSYPSEDNPAILITTFKLPNGEILHFRGLKEPEKCLQVMKLFSTLNKKDRNRITFLLKEI